MVPDAGPPPSCLAPVAPNTQTYGLFIWLILHVLTGGASVWFGGVLFGGGDSAKSFYKYHR